MTHILHSALQLASDERGILADGRQKGEDSGGKLEVEDIRSSKQCVTSFARGIEVVSSVANAAGGASFLRQMFPLALSLSHSLSPLSALQWLSRLSAIESSLA